MTVKQLIEKLKLFPEDMPVTTFSDITPGDVDDPSAIEITIKTWEDCRIPYDRPSFQYVDLI